MDCCKEKDCCPCADRIECLQAQISQLTEMNDKLSLVMKMLVAAPMVNSFLPEEITEKVNELSTD